MPRQVDPTDLGDPHGPMGVGGHAAPPAEGSPPKPQGTHPPTPHHPTTMPVHGGSPPHDAAVARPRHPHPKLPPPHRGGHARHPAMLLPDPRLPPASTKPHTTEKQADTKAQPRTPQTAGKRGTTPQNEPKHTHPRPQPRLAGVNKTHTQPQPGPNHRRKPTVGNPVPTARALRQPEPSR